MIHMEYCPYCMNPVEDGQACSVCGLTQGSYTPLPHHLPPGTVLKDRYLIGRVLGEGGFGITYIGCDRQLEVRVAIKEYFPVNKVGRRAEESLAVACYTGTSGEEFEADLDRFLREARTMARLTKQPNIVSVYDFFRDNGTAYIVMEYIDGTTFKELTNQRGGRIPAWELLHLIEPLFFALQTMHDAGLIHRDISPENIMLENGMVRLLDFGCTRDLAGDKTMTTTLKASYAPVEQYQGKGQGPWTDIYALASTIYYCLTGIKPPQAMDRLVEDELILPRKLGVDLTEKQEEALLRGMRVRPRQRYQSMTEFHAALYEGIEEMRPNPVLMTASVADAETGNTEGAWEESDSERAGSFTESDSENNDSLTDSDGEKAGSFPASFPGWVKANPVIAGGAAAVIAAVLVLAIVLARGSDSGSGNGQEEAAAIVDDPAAEETGEEDTDPETQEEGTETAEETDEEDAWYAGIDLAAAEYLLLDGTAYISDGQAVSLIAALADEEAEAVVLQTRSVELGTGTIYVNKPLTVASGLESCASIIVGEGGVLSLDLDESDESFSVDGLLRAMDGGQIVITAGTAVDNDGHQSILWLENEEDLVLEEGASLIWLGGEEIAAGSDSDFLIILNEEELFADAIEVDSASDLISAMDIDSVSAVEITADITLEEPFEQTKPVRIAEGVTVTAPGEDQDLSADGALTDLEGDSRSEAYNWNICGTVLINRGTLQGDLLTHESETGEGGFILNEGTIHVSGELDSAGTLINLESGSFAMTHGSIYSYNVLNLGTMTFAPLLDGLNGLEIRSRNFINGGIFRAEGTQDRTAYLSLRCTGLCICSGGTFEIGEYAEAAAECEIQCDGEIILSSGTSSMINEGMIRLQSGTLDAQSGTWTNEGIVQTDSGERYLCPEGAEGIVTALHWTGQDIVWIETAQEFAEALSDDSVTQIWFNKDLTWEGDLTVSGREIHGVAITLSGGNVTVSGEGTVLDAGLDLGGGTLSITDGAVVILSDNAADDGNSNIANCSEILVDSGSLLFAEGGIVLEDTLLTIEADGRVTGIWGMDLYRCTVSIGQSGSLTALCGFGGDEDTVIANGGYLWGLYNNDYCGTLDNTGEFVMGGDWSGILNNDGTVTVMNEFSLWGTWNNRGTVVMQDNTTIWVYGALNNGDGGAVEFGENALIYQEDGGIITGLE